MKSAPRITLTSAPVLNRKHRPLEWSVTKNRQLGVRPMVLVAISTWPRHFLTTCMGRHTCGPGPQTSYGTSRDLPRRCCGTTKKLGWQSGNQSSIGSGNVGVVVEAGQE